MSKELAQPVHRRVTLLQHDMNSNEGEQEEWTVVGVPANIWANAQYATLTQGESLESLMEFRYGVATFDIYADDPTDIVVGFRRDGDDYAYFTADQFEASKHAEAATPEAIALLPNIWYHCKLIWCPQYVSIEFWDLDNAQAGFSKKRATSNRRMNVYFEVLAATGATLFIAGLTVQEGDDPEFFLTKRDSVMMETRPYYGSTEGYFVPGWCTYVDAVNERCAGRANIRAGYSRFRLKVHMYNNAGCQASIEVRHMYCTPPQVVDLPDVTYVMPQGWSCWVSDWFWVDGRQFNVYAHYRWQAGLNRVVGMSIEFE